MLIMRQLKAAFNSYFWVNNMNKTTHAWRPSPTQSYLSVPRHIQRTLWSRWDKYVSVGPRLKHCLIRGFLKSSGNWFVASFFKKEWLWMTFLGWLHSMFHFLYKQVPLYGVLPAKQWVWVFLLEGTTYKHWAERCYKALWSWEKLHSQEITGIITNP